METQIAINWTTIIVSAIGIIGSIFGYFLIRMVRGYDSQIKELFERTKNLPAIETDLEWIKDKIKKE